MSESPEGDLGLEKPADVTGNGERIAAELNATVKNTGASIVKLFQERDRQDNPKTPQGKIYPNVELIIGDKKLPGEESFSSRFVLSANTPSGRMRPFWAMAVYPINALLEHPTMKVLFDAGVDDMQGPRIEVKNLTQNTGWDWITFIDEYDDRTRYYLRGRSLNGGNFVAPDELTVATVAGLQSRRQGFDWDPQREREALSALTIRDVMHALRKLVGDKHGTKQASASDIMEAERIKDMLIGKGGLVEQRPKIMYNRDQQSPRVK